MMMIYDVFRNLQPQICNPDLQIVFVTHDEKRYL